jgi:hypothetical protein
LQSALYEIENEPVEPDQESSPEPEATAEPEKKPKSKQRIKRKVVDPEFKASPRAPVSVKNNIQDLSSDPFIEELLPEEKERYELAQWASANSKEHQGLDKKYLSYFKKQKEFIEKNKDNAYGEDFSKTDEWKSFQELNRPKVNIKDLERKKIVSEATTAAKEAYEPKIREQEQKLFRMKQEPVANQKIAEAKKVFNSAVPEEFSSEMKDIKKFASENPLEINIITEVINRSFGMATEFLSVMNGTKNVNNSDPVQSAINEFIRDEQDKFIKSGNTKRNGKTFIRMERYNTVPVAEKEKYYTFSEGDVVKLLALRSKEMIANKISNTRKKLESAGYIRGNSQNVEQAAPAPAQVAPRVPSPAPRAGNTLPSGTSDNTSENKVLSLLGL